MALFQTFYRHGAQIQTIPWPTISETLTTGLPLHTGLLPVMEIVFVLQKTQVVENERIEFESVWGMPMSGEPPPPPPL